MPSKRQLAGRRTADCAHYGTTWRASLNAFRGLIRLTQWSALENRIRPHLFATPVQLAKLQCCLPIWAAIAVSKASIAAGAHGMGSSVPRPNKSAGGLWAGIPHQSTTLVKLLARAQASADDVDVPIGMGGIAQDKPLRRTICSARALITGSPMSSRNTSPPWAS